MQFVNDDMDEMFRRAAENYPLDTKGADWNKVLAAMEGTQPPTMEGKKRKKSKLLWIFLLLPLGWICNRLYSPGNLEKQARSETIQGTQNSSDKTNNSGAAEKTNNAISGAIDPVKFEKNKSESSQGLVSNNQLNFDRQVLLTRSNVSEKSSKSDDRDFSNFSGEPTEDRVGINDHPERQNGLFSKRINNISIERKALRQPAFSINAHLSPLKNPFQSTFSDGIPKGTANRFYAGLVAGVDITTIRFQKVEDKGHDYGVLLGYHLSNRWSIESGIFLSSKYYYTDGKYLNTSRVYLPPNTRIDEASGDCEMLEVPLAVRYNFSADKQSGWFATLGSSSYFMKEEKYIYQYYYGTSGPVPHNRKYKNSSNNVLSTICVSGGYNRQLWKFADLRIEPYLKIPVAGMGVAELPMLSTGIHIGVTRRF